MANGRLGSAKLLPSQASLLYSNTSGSQAVVNVQATALSSTTNANIALAIDSASVTLNQTTAAPTIAAGSISQNIFWLDFLSNTRPLRQEFFSTNTQTNSGNYPVSYWDGSTWFRPATGFYGAQNWQKVDPYFITTPSAYGKSKASLGMQFRYDTTSNNMRWRYYSDLSTFTGQQFANVQQFTDPSGPSYAVSFDNTNDGYGASADPYSDWMISTNSGGSTYVYKTTTGVGAGGGTSLMQQLFGTNSPISYNHFWYAPRIMGSNGLFVVQPTGYSTSQFVISDPDFAESLGTVGYAVAWNSTATAGWWLISAGTATEWVGWFEYNPNDQRYYFEMVTSANRNIYSVSRAALRALTTRGNGASYSVTSAPFTSHGAAAWGSGNFVTRPQRIGASLWWTTTGGSTAYVSTDLKTWVLATTYFAANNYPANTFNVATASSTSYLYGQTGTANISKFASGFGGVSETAVLEYNTPISNYQRTGILLSNGDKLYAQNYGSVSFSATVMGYEG